MEFEDLKVEVCLEDDENNKSTLFDAPIKKYQNDNNGDFVTGFDVTTKEAQERKLKRAKRFGIKVEAMENEKEIEALPSCLAQLPKPNKDEELRYDSLLLFGVNEMSTKDVFDYFKNHIPGSIEWIDDISCVVVWDDENSAKRALVTMGTKYTPPKDAETGQDENMVENIWRIGIKHPKSKQLLMRYATKSDKKIKGAGSRSLYYLTHGHPNQKRGRKRGLVSASRQRKIKADQCRINEELKDTSGPEVEFLDIDMDETMDPVNEMDVDEPAAKVSKSDESSGDLIPRGNMYADREIGPKTARSRLTKPDDRDGVSSVEDEFSNDSIPDYAKIGGEGDESPMDENISSSNFSTNNRQDLRQKLKNRRKGFNPSSRPNLSIEVTED